MGSGAWEYVSYRELRPDSLTNCGERRRSLAQSAVPQATQLAESRKACVSSSPM
jgi:hypothetical protein